MSTASSRIRIAMILLVATLIAVFAPTPGARADEGEVTLELTELNPAVISPSDTLQLRGTISNNSERAFTDPQVEIAVQWTVPRSREGLWEWFDEADPPGARLEYRADYDVDLAAGSSTEFALTVPMSEVPFPIRFDNWGARGLEIRLTDGESTASVRTVGVFYPDEELDHERLEIATLVAATPTAAEWQRGGEDQANVDAETAERIRSITSIPDMTVALDPAVASTSVAEDLIALPWADADLAVLTETGSSGEDLLNQARSLGRASYEQLGLEVPEDIAWPADINTAVLTSLVADGYNRLVLPASANEQDQSATSNARLDIDDAAALAPDEELSNALFGSVEMTGVATELAARQFLLAQTAIISREANAPNNLLAVADRQESALLTTQDVAQVRSRMAALDEAPWIDLTSVAELYDLEATETLSVADLGTESVATPQLRTVAEEAVTLRDQSVALETAFGTESGLDDVRSALTIAPSAAWRLSGGSGADITDSAADTLTALTTSITLSPPQSDVNLFAEESAVPIVVTNTGSTPVTVGIRLVPDAPTLRVEGIPDVTLAPESAETVRIPVTALANGTTQVQVEIVTPDGTPIGNPSVFRMSVQAEWETVGTGILAGVLAVLLVIGLGRNIRRGRRRQDGNPPQEDATDQIASDE